MKQKLKPEELNQKSQKELILEMNEARNRVLPILEDGLKYLPDFVEVPLATSDVMDLGKDFFINYLRENGYELRLLVSGSDDSTSLLGERIH